MTDDTTPRLPADKEELRTLIAAKIEVDAAEIADGEDLIEWGLDSVTIMGLANTWRRAGADVDEKVLLRTVTVDGWWQLLAPAA
ncbi:phosphopantetheine-binding protein [Kutzneria chonburiensis]|uniref:Phosphopantetheine-binding protein n=1 Tax=Kutzneria chonburiensis TaxID=1483604 RepID=A0ABV6N8D7_9PSEU|nr:phosphopantetheine-binding protein [Kutzneria chonburiensis]